MEENKPELTKLMIAKTNKIGLFILFIFGIGIISAQEKPRVFVLTDIGGDPEDQMSMVRLII